MGTRFFLSLSREGDFSLLLGKSETLPSYDTSLVLFLCLGFFFPLRLGVDGESGTCKSLKLVSSFDEPALLPIFCDILFFSDFFECRGDLLGVNGDTGTGLSFRVKDAAKFWILSELAWVPASLSLSSRERLPDSSAVKSWLSRLRLSFNGIDGRLLFFFCRLGGEGEEKDSR